MAVRWAVADGGWSSSSTWNGGTQITSNDDVYLNGHNVSKVANMKARSIRNTANDDYSIVEGGSITGASSPNEVITGNLYQSGVSILINYTNLQGGSYTFTINGNVSCNGNSVLYCNGNRCDQLTINGNVSGTSEYIFHINCGRSAGANIQYDTTINGNVDIVGTIETTTIIGSSGTRGARKITINGNCKCTRIFETGTIQELHLSGKTTIDGGYIEKYTTSVNINSNIYALNNSRLDSPIININGNIFYSLTQQSIYCGISTNTLNILNPSTFTWRDISEPRINPFIIVTNADMSNTDQYPAPTNVKKDVPYAWGYMNGMMLPDYPQPANVLKDIEYGRHCAGRNDIVTYDNSRYVYVKTDGEYHWEIEHITSTDVTAVVDTSQLSTAYKGVTTTDIVTNPTANPVIINGTSTNISTDQYVRYGHSVYKWNGSEWILYQTDPKNVPTISIDGASVTAVNGYVVEYSGNDKYYMWNSTDIEWQEQTMNYLGETTTNVTVSPSPQYVTLPYSITENSYIGTLLSEEVIQRLAQSVTVPILQQILDAHLN